MTTARVSGEVEVQRHRAGTAANDARSRLLAELPARERRLRLAGIATAVLEGGDGPPIVLLHGPGEHAAKWLRVFPLLTQHFHLVAPDLPAHGASESLPLPPRHDQLMQWLGELVDQTCRTRPILLGQIIGGAIAARFAAGSPDSVRGLVLADSLGLAPFEPDPDFGRALMEFNTRPNKATHDELWRLCAHDLPGLQRSLGTRWDLLRSYNLDLAGDAEAAQARYALMETYAFPAMSEDDLAAISAPVILIWGRHDLATPLAVAQAASQRYAWPLHVIEDAGDDPALEQPADFSRVVRTFARSLPGD